MSVLSERSGKHGSSMNASVRKVGGACAIVVGIFYVLVGMTYLLLVPEAQRGGPIADPARALPSIAQNAGPLLVLGFEFGLLSLFALGALVAITDAVRVTSEGWARWAANVGAVGYIITAFDAFHANAVVPRAAAAYVAADASAKATIAADFGGDTLGWLTFGPVGFWMLVVSALILRSGALPRAAGYVGIVAGVMNWLVVAGDNLQIPALIAIASALGGVIAVPVWFIWIGWSVASGRAQAVAPAASI